MAHLDHRHHTITCQIAFYGPSHAGKRSSLEWLHAFLPTHQATDLQWMATETARGRSCMLTPADQPCIHGYEVQFQLRTMTGAVLYARDRTAILAGADGCVFVADSNRDKLQENITSMQELARALAHQRRSLRTVPLVFQYNKRDIPDAVPVPILEKYLRPPPWDWQYFETVATWTPDQEWALNVLRAFNALRELVLAQMAEQWSHLGV